MSLFQTILSQIKERLDSTERESALIASIIGEHLGITIPITAVVVKKGVLRINVSPTIKMAIMIKKEAMIASLKEKGIKVHAIA